MTNLIKIFLIVTILIFMFIKVYSPLMYDEARNEKSMNEKAQRALLNNNENISANKKVIPYLQN
ncbi:MAG: hypothetical protein M3R36_19405 [Bacteroidota bacterium]|nr:hypothetical protein [Bacteroidota bacterium]